MKIRVYDNGGKTVDRFTVVFMERPERRPMMFQALAMNERPFHPMGFGQHTTASVGPHLGKQITLNELPEDCQKMVMANR